MSLKKFAALAGILYPILQMTAQGFIQVGGIEPAFSASSSEIITFFQNRDPSFFQIGGYISMLTFVLFLWFLGALWEELNSIDSDNSWLAVVAIGSGLVTTSTYISASGWSLALFRIQEGLSPELARYLFDQGSLNFANSWVFLGSMVLASGLLFRSSDNYPKWLITGSTVLAIALILARVVWTSRIAFAPYIFFLVWLIAVSVNMYRRS